MPTHDLSLFAPLREAYEASRRVRTARDVTAVLERVAALVSDHLGWGTVVVNVHRRAWDDFEAAVVHGSEEGRRVLLGTAQGWAQWGPLFQEQYERRGAHFIPAEAGVPVDIVSFVPTLAPSAGPDAWQPDDMLLVLMRGADGDVTGILSVDAPESGLRPTDAQLDVLVTVANAAGAALEQAREAAIEAHHQDALRELLAVSTRIADARSGTVVLEAVCAGIRDALGFERVAVELADADGRLAPAAHVGWDTPPDVTFPLADFTKVMVPEYEQHGCYVVERTVALEILGLPDSPYHSQRNGRGPWAWCRHWLCVPLRDPAGRPMGFIWVDEPSDRLLPDTPRLQALRLFADQAQAALESARHYEQTLHMAEHDDLTGLPNRSVLLDRVSHALLRTRRADRTIALLFVDVDRFKAVNDSHGHDVGDEVLRAIAARIDAGLRPGDTVSRLGGDEFVVLCEDVRGEGDALEVAGRIRAALAAPIQVGSTSVSITASVGVALPGDAGDDAHGLLRFADAAMYRAKDTGRDAQQVASPALRADASERTRLALALDGSLERGEIRLVWQPVVSVPTGETVRVEALMRWEHPGLGHVAPSDFIPIAEDNGAIVPLGRWALEEACAQWARWRAALGPATPGIAVNLSPRQLRDVGLRSQIQTLITRHAMPRGALTVEITEGSLLDATPASIRTLARLRELGCSIELDDFGTGFSSLSSLEKFHVDGLKIDRSFISGRATNARAGAIAEAVLAMALALGLRATAEGVETVGPARVAALPGLRRGPGPPLLAPGAGRRPHGAAGYAGAAFTGGGVRAVAATTSTNAASRTTRPSVSWGSGSPKTTGPEAMVRMLATALVTAITGTASASCRLRPLTSSP